MHQEQCLCPELAPVDLETRVVLVMHHRELSKPTATGPLALAALSNSELHVHGVRDRPLDLRDLHRLDRRVLVLFPSENAAVLTRSLVDEDPRPVTLVVPDGNWQQARKIPRRVPGLDQAQCVTLPSGPPSAWGVRTETKAGGLATFEAIARALGTIEGIDVRSRLEVLFARMVERTVEARGGDRAGSKSSEPFGASTSDPLTILYSDEHLVAIDKPSGLLVHRGWAKDHLPALQRLREQLGRFVYPLHRLDRGTSGVLMFALSSEVARDMQRRFDEGKISKRYLALCRGASPTLSRVDHPLARDPGARKRGAVTDFRLLGHFERYGLFEARPHTGRTHQIRRHLKHASHPIIGDVRYGKGEHNRIFRDRFEFHRLALHCHRMSFDHPRRAARITIEAPPAEDLERLLDRIELLNAV